MQCLADRPSCSGRHAGSAGTFRSRMRYRNVRVRAEPEPDLDGLRDKFFGDKAIPKPPSPEPGVAQRSIIDDVNPIELGRQARQRFDAIWGSLTSLTSPTKSYAFDEVLASLEEETGISAGEQTAVLVAGATGQVGRIVVRKLLLRGFKVRALVRKRSGIREEAEGVPEAVEIVEGDVGELKDCERAVRGVDKVGGQGGLHAPRGRPFGGIGKPPTPGHPGSGSRVVRHRRPSRIATHAARPPISADIRARGPSPACTAAHLLRDSPQHGDSGPEPRG